MTGAPQLGRPWDGHSQVTSPGSFPPPEYPASPIHDGVVRQAAVTIHGRVRGIIRAAAWRAPAGVIAVLHHLLTPSMAVTGTQVLRRPLFGRAFLPRRASPCPWVAGAWTGPLHMRSLFNIDISPLPGDGPCWLRPQARPWGLRPAYRRRDFYRHPAPAQGSGVRDGPQHARSIFPDGDRTRPGVRPARRRPAGARQTRGRKEQPRAYKRS